MITTFGRSKDVIEKICQEAMELRLEKDRNKTTIYVLNQVLLIACCNTCADVYSGIVRLCLDTCIVTTTAAG